MSLQAFDCRRRVNTLMGANLLMGMACAMALFSPSGALAQGAVDMNTSSVTVDLSVLDDGGRGSVAGVERSTIPGLYSNATNPTGLRLKIPGETAPVSALHVPPPARMAVTGERAAPPTGAQAPVVAARQPFAPPQPIAQARAGTPTAAPPPPATPPQMAPAAVQQAARTAGDMTKPGDQVRITFGEEDTKISPADLDNLKALAAKLRASEDLRLQLMAYAGNDDMPASKARRISLSRALAVRSLLIEHGVRSTRIDIRALGNKTDDEPRNRVDVVIADR